MAKPWLFSHSLNLLLYIMGAIIQETYGTDFGTVYQTYKEAVKTDSSIIIQGVKCYLGKRDGVQVKTKPEASNNFISPGAKFELEIDIMDMESKGAVTNTRYGLVAIDNFTKIAEVAPIKDTYNTRGNDWWFE